MEFLKKFESQQSRLSESEFVQKIRDTFADELDELTTDPQFKDAGFNIKMGKKIRVGEKIDGTSVMINDLLVRVGQDFRLTPEEIDSLKEIIFKK